MINKTNRLVVMILRAQNSHKGNKQRSGCFLWSFFFVIVVIVVIVVTVSGALFSYKCNRTDLKENVLAGNIPEDILVDASGSSESNSQTLNTLHNTSHSYDGVAVTLMLGSPKWFQQRYSIMINQVHAALPPRWIIQIFFIIGNKMSEEAITHPGIQKRVARKEVVITPIPSTMGRHVKRKDLLRSPWLWEHIIADRVFLFGGNSVLCADTQYSFEDFAAYDYVGAPWGALHGRGGSGEMSLRNRSAVLDFIHRRGGDSYASSSNEPEDIALVKGLTNVAPKQMTMKFAVSSSGGEDAPMGIAGTLSGLNDSLRSMYINYCPEIKMLFPVLSSSACFGAGPKPLQCFKYLCENGGLHCKESGDISWKDLKTGNALTLSMSAITG